MHIFLPSDLTDTVLVPIVKDKTVDISDKGNYRHIAQASVISKVFEMALLFKLEKYLYSCIHLIISLGLNRNTLQIYVYIR